MEFSISKFRGFEAVVTVMNYLFIYSRILIIISGKYSLSVPADLVILHTCTLTGSKLYFLLECFFQSSATLYALFV